jgi:hypothetical protein
MFISEKLEIRPKLLTVDLKTFFGGMELELDLRASH